MSAAKAIAQSHWIEMRLSILKEPIRGNEIPWLLVSVHPVRAVDRRWWGLVAFVEMCGDCGEVKGWRTGRSRRTRRTMRKKWPIPVDSTSSEGSGDHVELLDVIHQSEYYDAMMVRAVRTWCGLDIEQQGAVQWVISCVFSWDFQGQWWSVTQWYIRNM